MDRDERPRHEHQATQERCIPARNWDEIEGRNTANDRAIEKAKQLEDALSRHIETHGVVSLKSEIAPFIELVKAGGVPLGLPTFPLQVGTEETMTLAEIRRDYFAFCQALRELQSTRL